MHIGRCWRLTTRTVFTFTPWPQLTGYSRGTAFFANRLVHLPGYGDFQLRQIEAATDPDQASRLNLGGRARHLSESRCGQCHVRCVVGYCGRAGP